MFVYHAFALQNLKLMCMEWYIQETLFYNWRKCNWVYTIKTKKNKIYILCPWYLPIYQYQSVHSVTVVVEDEEEGQRGAGGAGLWSEDAWTAAGGVTQWGHGNHAEKGKIRIGHQIHWWIKIAYHS